MAISLFITCFFLFQLSKIENVIHVIYLYFRFKVILFVLTHVHYYMYEANGMETLLIYAFKSLLKIT